MQHVALFIGASFGCDGNSRKVSFLEFACVVQLLRDEMTKFDCRLSSFDCQILNQFICNFVEIFKELDKISNEINKIICVIVIDY